MVRFSAIPALAALALAAGCAQEATKFDYLREEMRRAEFGYPVKKVVDSSTFVIDWRGLGDPADYLRVKLVGVETPSAVEFREAYGRSAAAYLQGLLRGKRVEILIDTRGWYRPLLPKGDRTMFRLRTMYKQLGHIPGFVWIARDQRRGEGGRLEEGFVNRLMLESGLCRVDRSHAFRRAEDRRAFLLYESYARERGLGLWR